MTLDREALQVTRSLELAVIYTREVGAGVERIWENVFDWEHLPVLHETYFNAVEPIEAGDWGWRVALTKNPGTEDRRMVLEMRADRENVRYRVQTLAGDGAGTEIWTLLTPLGPHRAAVEVRYYLPERRPQHLAALGGKYRASWCRCPSVEVPLRSISIGYPARADRRPETLAYLGECLRFCKRGGNNFNVC